MRNKILDSSDCRLSFTATFNGLGLKRENNGTFVWGLCLKDLYVLNSKRVTLYGWVPLTRYYRAVESLPLGSTIQFSAYMTNSTKERGGKEYDYPLIKNPFDIRLIE